MPAAALEAFLHAMAPRLGVPLPVVQVRAKRGGRFELRAGSRRFEAWASAPVSLLAKVWGDDVRALEAACLVAPGRWPLVLSAVRSEGAASEAWRRLVTALSAAGAVEEAQLAWVWADEEDPEYRRRVLRLPRALLVDEARSAAALLEPKLGFARSPSAVVQLVVALELVELVGEALVELDRPGLRRDRFVRAVGEALVRLRASPAPAVRDAARLAAQGFARADAVLGPSRA